MRQFDHRRDGSVQRIRIADYVLAYDFFHGFDSHVVDRHTEFVFYFELCTKQNIIFFPFDRIIIIIIFRNTILCAIAAVRGGATVRNDKWCARRPQSKRMDELQFLKMKLTLSSCGF